MGLRFGTDEPNKEDAIKTLATANANPSVDRGLGISRSKEQTDVANKLQNEEDQTAVATAIAAETDKQPNIVSNELGDTGDANKNNAPENLVDKLASPFKLNLGTNRSDFLAQLDALRDKDTETSKVLKNRIKQIQNRETNVDLTPLLAFAKQGKETDLLATLLQRNNFTERNKEDLVSGLQLKLADNQDKFKKSLRAIESKFTDTENKAIQKRAELQLDLAIEASDKVARELKDFSKDKAVQGAEAILSAAGGFAERLNREESYIKDANGKIVGINPAILQDIQFARARSLNGPGVLTDQDYLRAGGSPDVRRRLIRFFDKHKDGQILTKQDLIEFQASFKAATEDAKKVLRNRVNGVAANAPTTMLIRQDAARDIFDAKFRTAVADVPERLDRIIVENSFLNQVPEDKQTISGKAESTGTEVFGFLKQAGGGLINALGNVVSGEGTDTKDLSAGDIRKELEQLKKQRGR